MQPKLSQKENSQAANNHRNTEIDSTIIKPGGNQLRSYSRPIYKFESHLYRDIIFNGSIWSECKPTYNGGLCLEENFKFCAYPHLCGNNTWKKERVCRCPRSFVIVPNVTRLGMQGF